MYQKQTQKILKGPEMRSYIKMFKQFILGSENSIEDAVPFT